MPQGSVPSRRGVPRHVAALLAVVTVAASAAIVTPALAKGAGSGAALELAPRQAVLIQRIERGLSVRKTRFDGAVRAIEKRQVRLRALADRIDGAGGDVAQARALLERAESGIAKARNAEQTTIDSFNRVPLADDKAATFAEARSAARAAAARLEAARKDTRQVAVLLGTAAEKATAR